VFALCSFDCAWSYEVVPPPAARMILMSLREPTVSFERQMIFYLSHSHSSSRHCILGSFETLGVRIRALLNISTWLIMVAEAKRLELLGERRQASPSKPLLRLSTCLCVSGMPFNHHGITQVEPNTKETKSQKAEAVSLYICKKFSFAFQQKSSCQPGHEEPSPDAKSS